MTDASATIVTVPNLISFVRLCAAPVAVWMVLRHDLAWAFWLFLMAGLSDALDGVLARRGARSRLGALLDPIADKALLTSMAVVLAAVGLLPDWLAIMIVFRDVLIVGGVGLMAALGEQIMIRPLTISKINTALQLALIAWVLLIAAFHLRRPAAVDWLIWTVVGTTFISGALYVRKTARS